MDAFDAVIAAVLQRQGFWTLTIAKVELFRINAGKVLARLQSNLSDLLCLDADRSVKIKNKARGHK